MTFDINDLHDRADRASDVLADRLADAEEARMELASRMAAVGEAEALRDALIELADAAGVTVGWSQPHPRGINAAFTKVALALVGDDIPAEARRAAAMQLVNDDTDEYEARASF